MTKTMTKTRTKAANLADWASRHHKLNIAERYALGDAIVADKMTAIEAYDYLYENEVDLTPSQVREALTVREAMTPRYFQQYKAAFTSWSALYEWARQGAEIAVLNKLTTPITTDVVRAHYGKARATIIRGDEVRKASTEDLVSELNARMDDEDVVDEVIHVAVQASIRNSKRNKAVTAKDIDDEARIPELGNPALEVMSDLKDLGQQMRRIETSASRLNDDGLGAAASTFESDVAPAYGSLSLTILGARV